MQNRKFTHGFEIRLANDTKLDNASSVNFNYVHYVYPPEKHTISFKGGGVRIFVYEAFIKVAEKLHFFDSIKQVGGSSSGAIAAIVSSIHFVNSESQQAMFNAIFDANKRDLVGDSSLEKAYDTISSVIYKPFLWIANGFNWSGKKLNLLGIPFRVCAAILELVGGILSTRAIVGLYNLIQYKGIYRGYELQRTIRNEIQKYVQLAIYDILSHNENQQQQIIQTLLDIHLGEVQSNQFVVHPDITFSHFAELAKLPGSKFKELFITGARIKKESDDDKIDLNSLKNKKLLVFNADNEQTRNFPIHAAAKIATSIPIFYQPGEFKDEKYIDGGAFDNSPVRLAKEYSIEKIQQDYKLTDQLARLQVRVEYPADFKNHLWHKPQEAGMVKKFFSNAKKYVYKFLAYGIDVRAAEENSTKVTQEDYTHTTLQLEDFGLSRFAYLTTKQRKAFLKTSEKHVRQYFDNHQGEVAVIEHFHIPTESKSHEKKSSHSQLKVMPLDLQIHLLTMLENEEILTKDIFYYPCDPKKVFTEHELKTLNEVRLQEIERIKTLPQVKEQLQYRKQWESTKCIFDKLDYNETQSHQNIDVASDEVLIDIDHPLLPPSQPELFEQDDKTLHSTARRYV